MKIIGFIILGLVILSVLTTIWLLFFPSGIILSLQLDIDQRIGLAQLSIGIAGVLSLLLAILEFLKSQRLSKLKVWLTDRSNNQTSSTPRTELRTSQLVTHDGVLGYQFYFSLGLENIGNAPAKLIEVCLELDSPPDGIIFIRDDISQTVGKWTVTKSGTENVQYRYYGGDDLICYHHRFSKKPNMQWIKIIGDFSLFLPRSNYLENSPSNTIKLLCIVQSDGAPSSLQQLKLISLLQNP